MSTATEQAGKELRHEARVRSFLRGEILHSGGSMKTECTVRDISEDGARIEVPTSFTLPENFELFIPARNQRFRAKTVWRQGQEIGVEFKTSERSNREPVAQHGQSELHQRIQTLEDELTRMRRQFAQMRSAIERFTGETF